MDLTRPIVVGLGLAGGLVAAVALYAGVAPDGRAPGATRMLSVESPARAPGSRAVPAPRVSVGFAACIPPATLRRGVCVTHKVVIKVVPAAQLSAVAAQPSRAVGPGATGPAASPVAPAGPGQSRAQTRERADDADEHGEDPAEEQGEDGHDG
ncbi:MAG TPA: hypothetical protein VFJ97_02195 [Dermatophilaceae bacterium]|nr:hypothetical protein [Dermatophilaceae bacterium]